MTNLKGRIVLLYFRCEHCECDIIGSQYQPEVVKLKDNNQSYIKTRCPYCKQNFYIKLINNNPVNCLEEHLNDDIFVDEDNKEWIGKDN